MNRLVIPLLLAVVGILYLSGCQKNTGPKTSQAPDQALISAARAYFNDDLPDTESQAQDPNPRTTGQKTPDWTQAKVIEFNHNPAVLVPVHYSNPSLMMTSFSGSKLFDINNQVQLLVYKDSLLAFHAQVVSSFPDSLCPPGGRFRGVILVDDWDGRPISRYLYDGTSTRVFKSSVQKAAAPVAHIAPTIFIQAQTTCTVIYGYNYAGDGSSIYYWEEEVGCDTEIIGGGDPAAGYGTVPVSGGGGSGGSGGSNTSSFFIVPSGKSPIANITDYIKCYTNVPGSDHTYQVTVCVDQPDPGTRTTWGFDGSGSSSGQNPIDVGHTFLVLTEITPNSTTSRNVGFYPQSNVTPLSPHDNGQLNNDENHAYNICLTITMTSAQFFTVLNFVGQGNNPGNMYDLNYNNCTNFAINAVNAAGFNLPSTIGTWVHGQGNNPGDLGEDIRQMQLSSNMTRNTVYNYHPNQGTCN